MPVQTPPLDQSGGAIIIQYTNGITTHRMKLHVAPFNLDATGSYVAPPAGQEASVAATAGAFISAAKGAHNTAWTFSHAATYQMQNGVLTQTFVVVPQASQTGTNANPDNLIPEEFWAFNLKTKNGSRARFFMFQKTPWSYGPPETYALPVASPNFQAGLLNYVTGSTTGIRGHDGSVLVGPGKVVYGINRRIRRRRGWA